METTTTTKVCKKCGKELDMSAFPLNKNSKDGHSNLCSECLHSQKSKPWKKKVAIKVDPERPLSKFTPRQLMEELRIRGYDGELTFTQKIRLSAI